MDRLGELRTLLAIVDEGSLAAAARRLGRSAPAVTRDLAGLERRAGTCLVVRSTRNCRPTPAGSLLAERARQLLTNYAEAIGEAGGDTTAVRGPIRVTAPITFGGDYVAPLVASFLDQHPKASVELQLGDRLMDLEEEEIDLAVRIGRLADSPMIARTVGHLRRMVVASPAYLKARGTPRHPDDLVAHDIIQHTGPGQHASWTFNDHKGGSTQVDVRARFTVNQPEAAIAAARGGRGLVRALSHQVDGDVRQGLLLPVLTEFEDAPHPVSLVWPASRRSWRRVRALIDHLRAGLGRLLLDQPAQEGRPA
jgi:DNA-binding transcriptional LysR family regulator